MKERSTYIFAGVAILIVLGTFYFFGDKKQEIVVPNENTTEQTATSTKVVVYENTDYGFSVTLPKSWTGFEVIDDVWEGYSLTDGGTNQVLSETGPYIYVRHPDWTEEDPRQDIPVMVFTLKQWADIEADKFHIGAAPFGPGELARNSKYVFALPARYNYAFPTGYEEVETLIYSGAVKSF